MDQTICPHPDCSGKPPIPAGLEYLHAVEVHGLVDEALNGAYYHYEPGSPYFERLQVIINALETEHGATLP